MPELPESKQYARFVPRDGGQVIAARGLNRPDFALAFPSSMAQGWTGQTGDQLRRRSKYILADLSSGESLLRAIWECPAGC